MPRLASAEKINVKRKFCDIMYQMRIKDYVNVKMAYMVVPHKCSINCFYAVTETPNLLLWNCDMFGRVTISVFDLKCFDTSLRGKQLSSYVLKKELLHSSYVQTQISLVLTSSLTEANCHRGSQRLR